METGENTTDDNKVINEETKLEFKKPQILVGKIGKLPRKTISSTYTAPEIPAEPVDCGDSETPTVETPLEIAEKVLPFPYKEPKWSDLPVKETEYKLEVLKSGSIIEEIDLTTKPFHVFGRLPNCDVVMAHPTISRYHMVLQYKSESSQDHPRGFYAYDLGSTHGSFLNKNRLKPNHYSRMMVGHMFKLGTSSRSFILQGPDEDQEEESKLSLTEIKMQKMEELEARKKKAEVARIERNRLQLEEEKKAEAAGVSWGMADDAEEETDLSENPYAATTNEELYLEDPKKTLRGFFEREGATLDYDCEERGVGQFVCRVELPIDDSKGRAIVAEVVHKGKKKEAVIQCALEACRIIDRHGLLRQARHESRKRKEKDWQSEDFYDSDDDTFLDRTGKVEEKRKKRIARFGRSDAENPEKSNNEAMTYDALLEKVTSIKQQIEKMERNLTESRNKLKAEQNLLSSRDGDELEAYMTSLSKGGGQMSQKAEISKMKLEIQSMKMELAKAERLAEIARPASLPALVKPIIKTIDDTQQSYVKKTSTAVMFGKRIKLKHTVHSEGKRYHDNVDTNGDFEEEVESDEETSKAVEKAANDGEGRNDKNAKIESRVGVEKNRLSEKEKEPLIVDAMSEKVEKELDTNESQKSKTKTVRVFGPMRPPENYVVPESYFEQESDRDLPEISEEDQT